MSVKAERPLMISAVMPKVAVGSRDDIPEMLGDLRTAAGMPIRLGLGLEHPPSACTIAAYLPRIYS